MPQLNAPEFARIADRDGRPTMPFLQWLTQAWRAIAPERAFYIPSTDGAPTFTPETRAGFVAMAYDKTNDALYVYNPDTPGWVSVSLT